MSPAATLKKTVPALLRAQLRRRPDRIALRDPHSTLTYRQVWDAATRACGGLRTAGLTRGDRVIVMLDNHVHNAIAFLGLSFAGAVAVPTNTAFKGSILSHVIVSSGATTAIVEQAYVDAVVHAAGGRLLRIIVRGAAEPLPAPGIPAWGLEDVLGASPQEPCEVEPWDVLMVGYTSGTTGPSKGALLTHTHVFTGHASWGEDPVHEIHGPHDEDDVFYVVCPLFHATGLLGNMLTALSIGASAYIAPSFSASAFWAEADRVGATTTTLVGTMAHFLMNQPPRPSDRNSTMAKILMVPLLPNVDEMAERFGVTIRSCFGNTETGTTLTPLDDEAPPPGACGKARPGYEIRLVDEHDLEVPIGTAGELVVRCDQPWQVAYAYVGDSAATAGAWRNGWFHTGDALRVDENGYYYFVDRMKDAIRRRGENISSLELERELLTHPDVAECAAVGVPSTEIEEEVKIYVVRAPEASLSEEQVVRYLAERLPYFMVPRYVEFREELPRTSTQKVQKAALRAEGAEGSWDREAAGVVVERARVADNR